MSLVVAEAITKDYQTGDIIIRAIGGISFAIDPASLFPSSVRRGVGKRPCSTSSAAWTHPPPAASPWRARMWGHWIAGGRRVPGANIGFIFQDFNLLPVLTAYENIEYPLIMVQMVPPEERRRRVTACWRLSEWRTRQTSGRTSSRAGRSNGWPSPGLW
jgi:putative ABC transport system ATP-binding protein